MSHYDNKTKRALTLYVFIFLLLVLAIAISGHLSYSNFEEEFRHQAENQISAIAELKAAQLIDWRQERLIDAQSFYHNAVFSGLVERYFENPTDMETRKQIVSRLEYYQSHANYDGVCLLDAAGNHRLIVAANLEEFKKADPLLMTQIAASLDSGNIIFLDFQRDPNAGGQIYISILIPLFADQTDGRPLGILVFKINPETHLYSYINQWPIPSDTAESLLVRRDGEDVLFLNQLRFDQNAALNLRYPLTQTEIPAVKAVLGQTGLVEGPDYRGELVLADVRPIPDSSWFLVSKVDIVEVYAPLRERLWQTLLIVSLAILVAGAAVITIWRQQRLLFYRAQADVAQVLLESEEKFRKAFILSPDAININRLHDGAYVSINKGFTKIMGYTPEDTIGKTSLEMNIWADPQDRRRLVAGLEKDGEVSNLEARFRAKNGDIKHGLMSASALELNGVPHIISITRDITERKQVEVVLKQSEMKYRLLVENQTDLIVKVDNQGNFLYVSPSYCKLFGKTEAELLGHSFIPLVHKEDVEATQNEMKKLYHFPYTCQMEQRAMTKDGWRWLGWSDTAEMNQNHEVISIIGVGRDITERKQAEEALKENEAIFSSFLEHSPVYVFFKDKDIRSLMLSKNYEQMLGLPIRDLIGKTMDEIFPSDLAKKTVTDDQRILNEAKRITVEEEFNGRLYETTKFPVLKDGKPYLLAGFTLDITERKRAEEALIASTEFSNSLIASIQDGISVLNTDNVRVVANPALCRMVGFSQEELLNCGTPPFPYWPPEEYENIQAALQQTLKNETANFELTFMRKNGERFPVMVSPSAVRNGMGDIVYYMATVKDITDRKRSEEALYESEARFRALFEQAAVGVAQLDTNTGCFLRINQKYCDILGYTRREMLDLNFQIITHPDDLGMDLSNMQRLIAGEIREFSMEKRYYRKDGGVVWVSLNVSPLWAVGELPNSHIAVVEDITSRKLAEEALEKRIIALTQPLENTGSITFGDLFNLADIQKLQDDFSDATGVASIITQVDGTPITIPSNFCRLCKDIIRKTSKGYVNCCKSDAALGEINFEGPHIQPCMSGGLWDAGAGISVGGKHIANWLIGQVRDETQTEEKILEYARLIGADEQAALEAFNEVPAMTKGKFEQIANVLFTLANQLSTMAYQNVQQARFIAERRQAEKALLESEERFRTHYDNATIGLYRTTPDGHILMLNRAGVRLLGFDSLDEISKRNLENTGFEAAYPRSEFREKLEREGVIIGLESKWTRKDGSVIFVRESAKVFRDENGKILHYDGSFEDITAQVQAEAALRESEKLHRKMNENSPLGMHFYNLKEDNQLIFTGANPAADKLLGVNNSQFIGKTIEEAFPVLVQTEVPQRYREAAAKGIPWVTEQIDYEDNQIKGAFGVRAFQTTPQNMVAVFEDITTRKLAEEKIFNLNVELEQRVRERTLQLETTNKELEAFSYSVSHDLRAPLRGIDGWSQALLEDYQDKLDDQGRLYIDRVRSETQRMGQLIDDMLQLSRLTRTEMVREEVDLSSLALSVADRLKREAPRRQVDFLIQPDVIVMGDPHLLEAVFTNLLGNAFKFTSKRAEARIEFGQTELLGQRVFFVRDNGAGFDMTYAQKLFGAFQRMHKASEFPGTGVGLAIVQRVIHRHGGRVWAEAEVGLGASFYFTLEEIHES